MLFVGDGVGALVLGELLERRVGGQSDFGDADSVEETAIVLEDVLQLRLRVRREWRAYRSVGAAFLNDEREARGGECAKREFREKIKGHGQAPRRNDSHHDRSVWSKENMSCVVSCDEE